MSHRPSQPAAALLAVAAVLPLLAGCPDDPVRSSCLVETHEVIVPHQAGATATPLMLLPDARLDTVGDHFVLLGTEGDNVRWAVIGRDGVVRGDEQMIAVPAHGAGPWFAAAGIGAPGDHLVVAYLPPSAGDAVADVDLMTFSVLIDNTTPTLPAPSGRVPPRARVAMRSGRGGMHAGITWGRPGQTTIFARIVGGDGLAIGPDLDLGAVADFDCLRFSAGRGDLTVGYVDLSGLPPDPTFVGVELDAGGAAATPFRLRIGVQVPGCVELAPSDKGYGVAWRSLGIGTSFGVYDPASPAFPSSLVLSDVRVSGEPPSPAGLGWMGKDYALVFARETGAEVWPLDASGQKHGVLPVFPSQVGHTGAVSTQPVGTTLYATYADYASTVANDRSSGARLLVKVSCP